MLYYFFSIKRKFSTTFQSQTDSQIKRQNSTIEAYLWVFVNFKQNNWAQFFLIAEFTYNNAKNASANPTPFELNCRYHFRVFYKKDLDLYLKLKTTKKLFSKLQVLMTICQQNLYYAQEFLKQVYDKGIKLQSYSPSNKVWLSSKHLKTKQNCKLETKFLGLFQILYLVSKQAYKLELPKKWRIYDVFYVLLLEQNTTNKEQVNDM